MRGCFGGLVFRIPVFAALYPFGVQPRLLHIFGLHIVLLVHKGPNLSSRRCADCFRIALHFFHLDMPGMVASLVEVRSVLLDISQIHCLPEV